ncbi:DUF2357 domain-containing protein [Tenacibaculum finnmarkense]|uniref:DUF2357 domain-containing protein n=1 Tax=Tenacibaculum finnmarkense TaxID=2781243 RepID=UPI001EFB04AC|nr:DUF2357 domain-containing protein [Tenacibaculum finnmarkense]MCG8234983.1 DUF2357 domain-containing protein [Tenacibaculum finnmarkense genomovar ulcerans]MCG8761429.1 DUF2357 domain-containing protein [Tenacibaculum finnmarkense]MCG8786803.1 DUF2357 domain-containing protein [Tenacibaculum finnmarkense]MCG8829114.1 DUF2357 domain-containing protein [Tenacibaculum finnmarkense]
MLQTKKIKINLPHISEKLTLFIDAKKETDIEVDENDQYTNEPQFQLKEGCFYDYDFSDESYRLSCSDQKNIIQKRTRNEHTGRISPNIFVGTLSLEVFNIETPQVKHELKLEVQSTKTNYREDYQHMLNSITEKCTDLILQANSPVSHSFETDFNADNETLYQRFAFVKSIINSEEFEDAIHRIISSPTTKWIEEAELTDVRKIKRFKNNEIKQLINSSNRIKLANNHPLYSSKLNSISTKINSYKKKESVDTSENRFIKHALETFSKFCMDIGNHPNAGQRLKYEANIVTEKLENHLQYSLFKKISRPTTLKLNSPTLQKKEGYREVLKVWLKFDLAAKLVWNGGEDIYSGGKKDIATLYEYWLFFKLLDVLKSIFEIESEELEKLIIPSSNELSLQLKQGKFTAINGKYTKENRDLNIRFNYNRSFVGNKNISKAGSWTTTLRPDYTLSIWPTNLNETQAEEKEQIVHIHFDAKYKIANIQQILENKQNEELNNEKKDNLKGVYKNADLLKMHAYKDAIRRTGGAYVLYPGDTNKQLKGFHEILPGLGAFSIKPSENSNETIHLEKFLKEVLEHFLNNASQRENIASKAYDIHKNDIPNIVREPIPEYINDQKLIPDETFVLVGFSKNKKRLDWYNENSKYNFRMNDEKGSLLFLPKVVNAKFLLLRESGKSQASILYKLKEGIRVFSKEHLKVLKHPEANKDHYLIYDFEKESKDLDVFKNIKWNFKDLNEYQKTIKGKNIRSAAGEPFTVSLTELMEVKIK